MTGLTLDQFKEIVEFAQTYHQFGRYYDDIERAGITTLYPKWKHMMIKYIDSSYDSRDQKVWQITFRDGIERNDKTFMEPDFDRVMAYLKGGEE